MEALTSPFTQLVEMQEVRRGLKQNRGLKSVSGCVDSQKLHWIYGCSEDFKRKLILTFSDQRAKDLYEEYRFYDHRALLYPARDLLFYQADVHGNLLTRQRLQVVRRLLQDEDATVVTSFAALMDRVIPLEIYRKNVIHIDMDHGPAFDGIAQQLADLGYERTGLVEQEGQFCIRGNIVDVFSLVEAAPYRIEFWGDEIDSIRSFDPATQRTIENLTEIDIFPATELLIGQKQLQAGAERMEAEEKRQSAKLRKEGRIKEAAYLREKIKEQSQSLQTRGNFGGMEGFIAYFFDEKLGFSDYFLPEDTLVLIDEPMRAYEQGRGVELEFTESVKNRLLAGEMLPGQADLVFGAKETAARLMRFSCVGLSAIDNVKSPFAVQTRSFINAVSIAPYHNDFLQLIRDLKRYRKEEYAVLLVSSSEQRARRLAAELFDEGLSAAYSGSLDRAVRPGEIMTVKGGIRKGFSYPLIHFAVICEADIFTKNKQKRKPKKEFSGKGLSDFNELKTGDYVIHESHGVGIYRGLKTMTVDGVEKEYLQVEFAGGSCLYVLATQLEKIQKYSGGEGRKPKLNKLGSPEWNKTKTRVKTAVEALAKDLVELYAIRMSRKGYAYGKDTVWQTEFEEMFPFEETGDQLRAIAATKRDMESDHIMDRIICGDVGFGKTEIALRAAFKAVQENKQVAVLVPTTILAQQHYQTFSQRMKDFPVSVKMLSRFQTRPQQEQIVKELAQGGADIVIGTHRILSEDVSFRDLGLLVIDEEQRFGVRHKERIKKLKNEVDVLTLSATPIPRTLHMGLSGIRDMSVLEEPPQDRMAIQTYVCEFREELVREAIHREIGRGGQVYYVFNRVAGIDDITAKIMELVPEANVAFAHGQMPERQLESIMYRFINGEIDVLVSTTIIETGLDIPNVNTIIIHDADRFGLSQLYQLKGRVGRSNRTAYAFLLYQRDKILKEEAEKRLSAIREFTALGSGVRIAMKDLEIRGAGNVLGTSQHGHVEAVGYDLYVRMLQKAIQQERGLPVKEEADTVVDIPINALIPSAYVPNEFVKLDLYKRIAGLKDEEECDDMLDELTDRFGTPPEEVLNLLLVSRIKALCRKLDITEISGNQKRILLYMDPEAHIKVENIPAMLQAYRGRILFRADVRPYFNIALEKKREKDWKKSFLEILSAMAKYLQEA